MNETKHSVGRIDRGPCAGAHSATHANVRARSAPFDGPHTTGAFEQQLQSKWRSRSGLRSPWLFGSQWNDEIQLQRVVLCDSGGVSTFITLESNDEREQRQRQKEFAEFARAVGIDNIEDTAELLGRRVTVVKRRFDINMGFEPAPDIADAA